MPDPALGGRIGKVPDASLLEGAALDLQKIRHVSPAHPEVNPRASADGLRADLVKPARPEPFECYGIGRLGIDVVEFAAAVGADEVVGGPAVCVIALCEDHICPGKQKLPEPSGVLDVNRDLLLPQKDLRREAVVPADKDRRADIVVSHLCDLASWSRYCAIRVIRFSGSG